MLLLRPTIPWKQRQVMQNLSHSPFFFDGMADLRRRILRNMDARKYGSKKLWKQGWGKTSFRLKAACIWTCIKICLHDYFLSTERELGKSNAISDKMIADLERRLAEIAQERNRIEVEKIEYRTMLADMTDARNKLQTKYEASFCYNFCSFLYSILTPPDFYENMVFMTKDATNFA